MKVVLTNENRDTPVLTETGVMIGQLFLYDNRYWVRVDRYIANALGNESNACRFGTVEQFLLEAKD